MRRSIVGGGPPKVRAHPQRCDAAPRSRPIRRVWAVRSSGNECDCSDEALVGKRHARRLTRLGDQQLAWLTFVEAHGPVVRQLYPGKQGQLRDVYNLSALSERTERAAVTIITSARRDDSRCGNRLPRGQSDQADAKHGLVSGLVVADQLHGDAREDGLEDRAHRRDVGLPEVVKTVQHIAAALEQRLA